MKRSICAVLAAVTLAIGMMGAAYANDTSDMVITANVMDTCTTITDGTPVTISLNPLTGGAVANGGVLTQPTINCTMGSTHAVTCTSLNGMQLEKGADTIAYAFNAGSVCGSNITGNGSTAVPLTLGIDIADGAYSNAAAGDYTDTITITVAY